MSKEQREDGLERSRTETFLGSAPAPLLGPLSGVSILFFHRADVERAQLYPGQSLIVGRHPPSDVLFVDRQLSSQHARLTLVDDHLLVEDLGSRNGVWMEGERVERASVPIGGEVMLGPTVLALVIRLEPTAPAALDREADFSKALDLEVARALNKGQSFAVLAVRAAEDEVARSKLGSWATALRAGLRDFDRVTLHAPTVALVLVPDVTAESALTIARSLREGPRTQALGRRIGVAHYPEDATSAYKLRDVAREAMRRASPERPVISAWEGRPAEDGDVRAHEAPIIGAAQEELFKEARFAANTRVPVLIQGESGTGKEVVARFIHENGPRRSKPYVAVNCGLWTESLLESRLFGHEKGAFTGALQMTKGVFERADGGTLFLDEIGELRLDAQAALLRVLAEQTLMRVGSTQEIKVDVRVVAATNRDLRAMAEEKRFREDLFYRLSTFHLKVPPLRSRRDEVARLVKRFVKLAAEDHRKFTGAAARRSHTVSPEAMALLEAYDWPGNVRELRNAIDRAVAVAQGEVIRPEHLPPTVQAARLPEEPPEEAVGAPSTTAPKKGKRPSARGKLDADRQAADKRAIEAALRESNGDTKVAAQRLGKSERTIRRRMNALGIKAPKR